MFSIIIPTYNNINYLKLCLKSIKKNSKFDHQIIIHVNEGSDGTLDFVKKNNYKHTFSEKNIGLRRPGNGLKPIILKKIHLWLLVELRPIKI